MNRNVSFKTLTLLISVQPPAFLRAVLIEDAHLAYRKDLIADGHCTAALTVYLSTQGPVSWLDWVYVQNVHNYYPFQSYQNSVGIYKDKIL